MEGTQATLKYRCYEELIRIPTFEGRYAYLALGGKVGTTTFGFDRYLNQRFYHSTEWRSTRDWIIARDHGCDLGVEDREIYGKIYIHHMNPILIKDLKKADINLLLDPNCLICVCYETHNAIHYGTEELLSKDPIIRRPGDTCPWKKD